MKHNVKELGNTPRARSRAVVILTDREPARLGCGCQERHQRLHHDPLHDSWCTP